MLLRFVFAEQNEDRGHKLFSPPVLCLQVVVKKAAVRHTFQGFPLGLSTSYVFSDLSRW